MLRHLRHVTIVKNKKLKNNATTDHTHDAYLVLRQILKNVSLKEIANKYCQSIFW